MIDSRAQDALLFMWSLGIAVLVRRAPSGVWKCDCFFSGFPQGYEAASQELAIERAARSVGWDG